MTHPLNGLGQQEPAEPRAPYFHPNNLNAQAFQLSPVEQQNLAALLKDSVPAPEADYGIEFHPNNLNAQAFQLSPTEEMHLAQLDDLAPEPEPPEAPDVELGELALDVTQIGLDVVGIIEPTPFADGANTIISAGRGDWLGAGLSLVGVVPYIGDLAKAGKVGKWAQTVAKAVDAATDSPAAARVLEPALRGLKEAVDTIPQGVLDALPSSAREAIESMKSKLDDFFTRSVDDAGEAAIRPMDELLPGGRVPSVRNGAFSDWFDDLSPAELRELWTDPDIRETIGDRIRHPGGLHEWYMVKHTPEFKDWGLSMDDIKDFRSEISELTWVNPNTGLPGGHGSHGSTTFHSELSEIIENSDTLGDVNRGIDDLLERWEIDPNVLPDLGG